MRTSLTRAVAGVAIAATALLAAAGTANASTPPRTATQLSIVAAKSTITVGQWDAIGGQLTGGGHAVAGRPVILDRWNYKTKKWNSVEEKLTGKYGKVAFAIRPAVTSWYALVFKGGSIYKPTHSGEVRVVVKPFVKVPTTLSIAQSATGPIAAKTTDIISGALSVTKSGKALAGQWVFLATVVNGKVHLHYAYKTGKYGKVEFKVHPTATTTYELVFLGTHVLAKTVSGTVTATVS